MNIQYLSTALQPRALVWCTSDEITDNGDGTYTINDAQIASTIGTGSEIMVMDKPGTMLYYSAEISLAYDWTSSS